MKRIEKGTPGYLDYKKKVEIIRTVIYFLLVAAILHWLRTDKTRSNLLTVVAILGCLPAAKALVGVITRFPYASVDQKLVHEVDTKAPHTTRVYDLVLTTREKIMPVECVVISNGTVFGYTDSKKVDLNVLSKHIRDMMTQNRLSYSTVKFYQDYKVFSLQDRRTGIDRHGRKFQNKRRGRSADQTASFKSLHVMRSYKTCRKLRLQNRKPGSGLTSCLANT